MDGFTFDIDLDALKNEMGISVFCAAIDDPLAKKDTAALLRIFVSKGIDIELAIKILFDIMEYFNDKTQPPGQK